MKYLAVFFAGWLLASSQVDAGTLTSSVNRTRLNHNETVELTLHYDDDANEEPDVSALTQHFDIVSSNRTSSIQIINGNAMRNHSWYYELLPRKAGTLLIPSFSINGDFSEAITLEVSKGPNNQAMAQQQIYTETLVDNTQVHVQQQVIVTWRLVTALAISDPDFQPPRIDGALVQDLGNRQYQRASGIGGTERVFEQRYAVFPQQSGEITIPAQLFVATVNTTRRSSLGIIHPGRTRHQLYTDEQTLTMLPAVTDNQPYWLPASDVALSQEIIGADHSGQLKAGEAFTRVIRIRAEGLAAEQLPTLDMNSADFKVYGEKPSLRNEPAEQGVIGLREERAAMIAARGGSFTLPAIRIPWYDTRNAQWREAVLPPTTLTVLATAGNTAIDNTNASGKTPTTETPLAAEQTTTQHNTSPDTTTTSTVSPWQYATAAFALLWAGTAILCVYLYRRQTTPHTHVANTANVSASPDSTTLRHAVQQGDVTHIHRELLAWSRRYHKPELLQHPTIQPLVLALEKHLYGNGPAPDRNDLAQLPARLDALAQEKPEHKEESTLPPLYR